MQATPQAMPAGDERTVPGPECAATTLAVVRVKSAETDRACATVTIQVPEPEQAPDQPVNVEPDRAAAVRVTVVPTAN